MATQIQELVNRYEKLYFERIKRIIEENGTTIFRNLTTRYNFNNLESSYEGMSEIANGMERVIQSIISEQTDWEIFSLPQSSDSAFITPKCVIQIDSKSTLVTDSDSTGHKITVGKNQISYASHDREIMYRGVPFKSNIPFIYNHNIYGELYSTTYFIKMHYDISNGISTFRNFKIYLACIPNGLLQDIYGVGFAKAGRVKTYIPYGIMYEELYNSIISDLSEGEINVINQCYDLDESNNTRTAKEFIYLNGNSINNETQKQLKKQIIEIFKNNKFNEKRESLRITLQDLCIREDSEYFNSEFDWNRYIELELI